LLYRLMVTIAAAGLIMIEGVALADEADVIEQGKALVELNCAGCHAVDRTGESKHVDAPPFRVLSQRYTLDSLEEAFAEGISTGHPDMPEFTASPKQIDSILTYIKSLND